MTIFEFNKRFPTKKSARGKKHMNNGVKMHHVVMICVMEK